MPDCFSSQFRSELMARIRSSGTSPEETLNSIVRASLDRRLRIDRNVKALPGSPDVVVPDLRLCIFADGCFFHGCKQHYTAPATRPEYWGPKLERNLKRDRANERELREQGWAVWRIWEHDLSGPRVEGTARRLGKRLARRSSEISR